MLVSWCLRSQRRTLEGIRRGSVSRFWLRLGLPFFNCRLWTWRCSGALHGSSSLALWSRGLPWQTQSCNKGAAAVFAGIREHSFRCSYPFSSLIALHEQENTAASEACLLSRGGGQQWVSENVPDGGWLPINCGWLPCGCRQPLRPSITAWSLNVLADMCAPLPAWKLQPQRKPKQLAFSEAIMELWEAETTQVLDSGGRGRRQQVVPEQLGAIHIHGGCSSRQPDAALGPRDSPDDGHACPSHCVKTALHSRGQSCGTVYWKLLNR